MYNKFFVSNRGLELHRRRSKPPGKKKKRPSGAAGMNQNKTVKRRKVGKIWVRREELLYASANITHLLYL